jgi:hypothetical protein
MPDEKITSDNPDAEAADQDKNQDKDKRAQQDEKHPGYKYYRKTRQFGG